MREDVVRGAARHGVRVVGEAFVDLDYDADGELIIEAVEDGTGIPSRWPLVRCAWCASES